MLLPLDQIILTRRALRRTLDPDNIKALAEDIERNGQIQPIAVRATPDGHYALIAGRRRVAAVALLGRSEILAHVMDAGPADEIRGAAENIKRVQLSPLEEADIVRDLQEIDNLSIRDIAEQTGHGTSWVQDRLAVAALAENLQQAIHTRTLSISAAMLLQLIDDIEYRDYLLHIATTNGATVHQAQAWQQDYAARKHFLGTNPNGGPQPQLPPLAPRPAQPCWACDVPTDADSVVLVRICPTCLAEVRTAKANAAHEASLHSTAPPPP